MVIIHPLTLHGISIAGVSCIMQTRAIIFSNPFSVNMDRFSYECTTSYGELERPWFPQNMDVNNKIFCNNHSSMQQNALARFSKDYVILFMIVE